VHLYRVPLYSLSCSSSKNLLVLPVDKSGTNHKSNGNIRTLLSVWRTALFEVFNLKDDFNLLYTQYCFGIITLPVNYVLDLRKLCF